MWSSPVHQGTQHMIWKKKTKINCMSTPMIWKQLHFHWNTSSAKICVVMETNVTSGKIAQGLGLQARWTVQCQFSKDHSHRLLHTNRYINVNYFKLIFMGEIHAKNWLHFRLQKIMDGINALMDKCPCVHNYKDACTHTQVLASTHIEKWRPQSTEVKKSTSMYILSYIITTP